MPITKSSSVAVTISNIAVDMAAGSMVVGFLQTIDGQPNTAPSLTIEGADFATLLATTATAGQSLANEITLAIYNYAVSKGVFTGTVS